MPAPLRCRPGAIRCRPACPPGPPPVVRQAQSIGPGLDVEAPARQRAYYVNEEEVPQAGSRLTVAYNRTRGRDGQVVVWLGARRGAGRGEATSGPAFDHLVDTTPDGPGAAG
ncbi:hypothetical protein Slala04_36320 [Streptomyces lavendulae subsp. lavendulae]|nr:hypothetical protein Slala04_36320 [Streptomyces lavendulae subsp. lavendulae]